MDRPLSGIYAIRDRKTGAAYVGSSVNVANRWQQHMTALVKGSHQNPRLQGAWDVDGPTGFSFEVLEVVNDPLALAERERHWIEVTSTQGATGLLNQVPQSRGRSPVAYFVPHGFRNLSQSIQVLGCSYNHLRSAMRRLGIEPTASPNYYRVLLLSDEQVEQVRGLLRQVGFYDKRAA